MLRLLNFIFIAQHCIGNDYKKSTFSKIRVTFTILTENVVYLSGVVPLQCMQTTISVTLTQL